MDRNKLATNDITISYNNITDRYFTKKQYYVIIIYENYYNRF